MALTTAQRRELVGRLIQKAHAGQIDADVLVAAIESAVTGTPGPLIALVNQEKVQFVADLNAGKAGYDAQSAAISAKLAELA